MLAYLVGEPVQPYSECSGDSHGLFATCIYAPRLNDCCAGCIWSGASCRHGSLLEDSRSIGLLWLLT